MSTSTKLRPTYFEELRSKGYSRRDFMKFCTLFATYMGLEASGVAQISRALELNPMRIRSEWLQRVLPVPALQPMP